MLRSALDAMARAFDSPAGFFAIAFLIEVPLVLNAGYFSHDELQWLALADQPSLSQVPWVAWFDFHRFQYRPVTFNLWLFFSYLFGYRPMLMHLVRVLFGLAAAMLLRATLIRFEVPPRHAAVTVCVFLLLPYTVFTHAWVGTFADSLYLMFLLAAIVYMLDQGSADLTWSRSLLRALPVAGFTALALLSKESAVTFPALFLVAGLRRRDRQFAAALLVSCAIVALYLVLRLETILHPLPDDAAYAWQVLNIPIRLAEYTVFPFLPARPEVVSSAAHLMDWAALVCVAIFVATLVNAGWRYLTIFCLGWIVALGPALALDFSSNQYAYVAGAFACSIVALAWRDLSRGARLGVAVLAVVTAVHGFREIREMRYIGALQHNLYAEIPEIVEHSDAPVLIRAQRVQEDFVLQRLLRKVPSYRHVRLADRVVAIPFAQTLPPPDYLMSASGQLIPAR